MNDISRLSYKTLIKLHFRIGRIREIFDHLATACLYRSMFKDLDKGKKIDISDLIAQNDDYVCDIHNAIMTIADKDTAHLDKSSKSHKILDVDSLRNGGSTAIVTSELSEDQLKKMINFLEGKLLPVINESIGTASKRK